VARVDSCRYAALDHPVDRGFEPHRELAYHGLLVEQLDSLNGSETLARIVRTLDQQLTKLDDPDAPEPVAEIAPPPPDSRIDLAEAGERLIAHLETLGRKRATIEAYESLLRVHLALFFTGRSLDAIGSDDVEALIRTMANGGSSAKTITNALGFLYSIFEYARGKEWAKRNPCEGVDLPRVPEHGEAEPTSTVAELRT